MSYLPSSRNRSAVTGSLRAAAREAIERLDASLWTMHKTAVSGFGGLSDLREGLAAGRLEECTRIAMLQWTTLQSVYADSELWYSELADILQRERCRLAQAAKGLVDGDGV